MMHHVVFISHARGIHGAETVMLQAIRACTAQGVRVTVVVPSVVPDAGLEVALQQLDNVRLMPLAYRAAGVHALRTYLVQLYSRRAAGQLAEYVRREHVDAIYSNSSITILGCAVAKMTGVKHIWHWHESVNVWLGWHPSMAKLYRKWLQWAETIVFISHKQQHDWEETLGVSIPNAQVVYNPIKRISALQKAAHKHIRIGFIGHFEPLKNIELLVQTFARLHAENAATELWLCGAINETDRQYIYSMTALREPIVLVLPQTSDVAAFYHSIDILVLPSWKETMPLVVPEAMQAGVCVIQTDQSGLMELLEDGSETLFFSPYKPEALLPLLQQCLDTDYRRHIAEAGQKKVQQLQLNNQFDQQITALLCAS